MMKKSLILAILISATLQGQRSAPEQISKGKEYLRDSPCNTTGIAWIEGALKIDPSNEEATRLLNECKSNRILEAKELLSKNPTDYKGRNILADVVKTEKFNTEENNFLIARSYIEESPSHYAMPYVEKIVSLNPGNLEYRYMRVKCNMLSSSGELQLTQAVTDLNYIIKNGGENDKMYANLGIAERELAIIYDHDLSNYPESVKHFNLAKSAFQSAKKISGDPDYDYKIKEAETHLKELLAKK